MENCIPNQRLFLSSQPPPPPHTMLSCHCAHHAQCHTMSRVYLYVLGTFLIVVAASTPPPPSKKHTSQPHFGYCLVPRIFLTLRHPRPHHLLHMYSPPPHLPIIMPCSNQRLCNYPYNNKVPKRKTSHSRHVMLSQEKRLRPLTLKISTWQVLVQAGSKTQKSKGDVQAILLT